MTPQSRIALVLVSAVLACGPPESAANLSSIRPSPSVPSSTALPAPVLSTSSALPTPESPVPTVVPPPAVSPSHVPTPAPATSSPPRTATQAPPSTVPTTAAPSVTVVPMPQTAGPRPTWTATPNPAIQPGVSGCVPQQIGSRTQDCVARGLPPGAAVTVTVNEIGGSSYFVNWLPPVDANGNVPFPYSRPSPGKVIFTVTAGSATVTFETTFTF